MHGACDFVSSGHKLAQFTSNLTCMSGSSGFALKRASASGSVRVYCDNDFSEFNFNTRASRCTCRCARPGLGGRRRLKKSNACSMSHIGNAALTAHTDMVAHGENFW